MTCARTEGARTGHVNGAEICAGPHVEDKSGLITFVAQNETHAHNFSLLAERLVAAGLPPSEIKIIHLDRATGLNTMHHRSQWSEVIELPTIESFYRLSGWRRVIYISQASRTLAESVPSCKILVIGNDGAMQRKMANTVRAAGGQIVLLLDGLLAPPSQGFLASARRRLKRMVFELAGAVGLDYVVPSEIGFFSSDLAFVMNDRVGEILRTVMPKVRVEVIQLPRHEWATEQFGVALSSRRKEDDAITYVTSAFLWHGSQAGHKLQLADLQDFDDFAKANPERKFRIRVHPREQVDYYYRRAWSPNITISSSTTPLLADLANAEAVITPRSTVALEAADLGIPVLVYQRNFGAPEPGSPLAEDDRLMYGADLERVLGLKRKHNVTQRGHTGRGTSYVAQQLVELYRAQQSCRPE